MNNKFYISIQNLCGIFWGTLILEYFNTLHVVNKTENHSEGQVLTIFMAFFFQILFNYLYEYCFLHLLI
jgi:hypothetical protein